MNNKIGLPRHIPEDVKLVVRKRCGYGCVLCGNGIYQYEHFSPEFAEATEHNADGITLLCGYCHDRKTRKQISVEAIIEANSSPKCYQKGFVSFSLDVGQQAPDILLGTYRFKAPKIILRILGENVFWLNTEENNVCLLNFKFHDSNGREICIIKDNELIKNVDGFDISTIGQKIVFKDQSKKIILLIDYIPRESLTIRHLKMNYSGFIVDIDQDSSVFIFGQRKAQFSNATFENCEVGIDAKKESTIFGYKCKCSTIGSMSLGSTKI